MLLSARAELHRPRLVTGALWMVTVPAAVWAAVRLLGLDGWYPMAQLVAFTPYLLAVAPLLILFAVLARRWYVVGLAALVTLALAVCVLPRWLPDGDRAGVADGPILRVLTTNLLAGVADVDTVLVLVRDRRVDLLAVQELTPDAVARLSAAGLDELLPHRVLYPETGVTGSGIYARHPLRDGGRRANPCDFGQARAAVTVPGAAPVLAESVHPCAPASAQTTTLWRQGLADQPPATVDGPVRLLLGDFNATLDHGAFRQLLATGYRDAADTVGLGLTGTWGPYDGDLIPPVTLDHVLVDARAGVRAAGVHAVPGSDHRAVYAKLILPAA